MSFAKTQDGVNLYYEQAGAGTAVLFVHEFGGNHWSWEPQMRRFSRRHQCIAFAARGFPPSDVPDESSRYSQELAASDIIAVMDAAEVEQAHLVGLSMGGFACLHAAIRYPARVLSVVAAGTGYGAEKAHEDYFRSISEAVATNFEAKGASAFAPTYAEGASRVQFQNKDPRGWREFAERLGRHNSLGAANTMRGVQMCRPSLYDLASELAALEAPLLVMTGDEDDHCLQPGLFLKRTVPRSGLAVFPKAGHTLNLEEPELFNRHLSEFLSQVEAGFWARRDPRADSSQIMRTN
ncbi:MAG: alpha/beta hydrolase [Rhizobiaceae bacterium]|nr:alpha/beta hydrolase [Rhizobiaceae bacterium]